MKKLNIVEGKVCILLVAAILILCAGFFIVACGVGPATKVANYNAGPFAHEFADLTLNVASATFPSIQGDTLTVEAWVKQNASSTSPAGIFGRYDATGALMWVTNAVPKFAIRVFTSPAASSTDYTVSATTALTDDTWVHVAGVLSNEDHSGIDTDDHSAIDCVDGDGNATGGNAETPHLDIYIDGALEACATTWGDTDDPTPTAPQGVEDPNKFTVPDNSVNMAEIGYINNLLTPLVEATTGGSFDGAIDEVRLWKSERTATEIANCMDAELSAGNAECDINDTSLLGYWRLNSGSGSDVHDSSGSGLGGTVEKDALHWEHGWVTGKFN